MQIKILGCSGAKSVGKSPTSFLVDNKILIDSGSVVSKLESDFIKNALLINDARFAITYTDELEAYYTLFMEGSTNEEHRKEIRRISWCVVNCT